MSKALELFRSLVSAAHEVTAGAFDNGRGSYIVNKEAMEKLIKAIEKIDEWNRE